MRRPAIGRIIGQIITIVGVGFSILFAFEAFRFNREYEQAIVARPMESVIDLSKTGEVVVPFHQTYGGSHGEAIYIDVPLDDEAKQKTAELFAGLSGKIVIRSLDGEEIVSKDISAELVQYRDGKLMLAYFEPIKRGDYVATIDVARGAAGLADKRQTIHARYHLCGCELLPIWIIGAFAAVSGFIGVVSAACVFRGTWRYGIWRSPPESSVSGRDDVVGDVSQGLAEFRRGEAKPASVDDIMRKIES
jgi:hypothetical protein